MLVCHPIPSTSLRRCQFRLGTRSSMQPIATAVFVRNGEYCNADKPVPKNNLSMESHTNRHSPITHLRRCRDRQKPLSLEVQISLMRSQYDSILHHRLIYMFPAPIARPYTDRHLLTLSLTTEIYLKWGCGRRRLEPTDA